MKTFTTIFALMLLVEAQAQTTFPHDDAGNICYSETIKVDSSLTKDQLYSRANEFFAKAFVSSKNVIQYQDKDEGKIIGKGVVPMRIDGSASNLDFTISIFVKDGKYKYTLTDLKHSYKVKIDEQPTGLMKKHEYNIQWNCNYEMIQFANKIREYMSKPKATDEW